MTMEVLVVESDPGAAVIAIAQLEAAGHSVRRCHEVGAPAFPCSGLEPGHCPLEESAIDVVLTVRGSGHARPTPLEDGVTCALRRHAPVVVAGRTTLNPFERYPVTLAGVDDIVGACERAAAGAQLGHEAVGTTALAQTLGHAGIPTAEAFVSVHRSGEGLRVQLHVPMETPKEVRDIASVRVVGALRGYDPYAPGINASCQDL
jgi:hypothetical protein